MKNSVILLADNPKGVFLEGIIGDTSLPGTIMQIQGGTLANNGRPTWIANAVGTAGAPVLNAVLLEDWMFTYSQAYVVGQRCRLYVPIAGEEMNVLASEATGTGNNYVVGDRLMIEASGGALEEATGTLMQWLAMETARITGTQLLWVMKG